MNIEEIAKKMVAKGKGILAADESTGTMEKRLKSVNVACTEKNRLHFRETLFSSGSMKNCISGVILFDERIDAAIIGKAAFLPPEQSISPERLFPPLFNNFSN